MGPRHKPCRRSPQQESTGALPIGGSKMGQRCSTGSETRRRSSRWRRQNTTVNGRGVCANMPMSSSSGEGSTRSPARRPRLGTSRPRHKLWSLLKRSRPVRRIRNLRAPSVMGTRISHAAHAAWYSSASRGCQGKAVNDAPRRPAKRSGPKHLQSLQGLQ